VMHDINTLFSLGSLMREFQTFLNLIARCLWLISYLSFQISDYRLSVIEVKKPPG
jgi:hypothetical protein